MRVAVAVDPEASAETAEKLSLPLLQLARSLADSCDGELRIVSCWDYELEGFLRRNSWVSLPAEHVSSSVLRAGDQSRARLNSLVARAGIAGKQTVHHLRGSAGNLIPHFWRTSRLTYWSWGLLHVPVSRGFFLAIRPRTSFKDCAVRC